MFEPFFSTKVREHSGLGLTLVREAVEKSGGHINFDTSARGTSVNVSFPILSARRILLVDDDDLVRESTCMMLTNMGHQVNCCANGIEALREMQNDDHDLVILDFAMPMMNGAEVANEMRRAGHEVPILFASGFLDSNLMRSAIGKEANILRKPYTSDELATAIQGV